MLGAIRVDLDELSAKLDAVLALQSKTLEAVQLILRQEVAMTAELETIKAQVATTEDVEDSATQLLNSLSTLILSLKDDPAAIAALAGRLQSSAADLAAAVVANTPAA
jgi:hypothetical protein